MRSTIRARAVAATLWLGAMLAPALAAQSTIVTPAAGPMSMSTYVGTWLNPALLTLGTCNSGSSAPANGPGAAPFSQQCWFDTSGSPWTMKVYDGAFWVQVYQVDPATHTAVLSVGEPYNPQSGTSYTFADGDRTKYTRFTNSAAVSAVLPRAGGSGLFTSGWYADVEYTGGSSLTITPTTSTINGASSLTLIFGQSARIISDGTNYFVRQSLNFNSPNISGSGTVAGNWTVGAGLILKGSGSGSTTIQAAATASGVLTAPATTDTLAVLGPQVFTGQQQFNPPSNSHAIYVNQCALSGSNTTACAEINTLWNTSGVAQALVVNATDTASDPSSRLASFRVATVEKFAVDKNGNVLIATWQGVKIGLAYGGTNVDLSATGGTSQVLLQNASHVISVARLACADLSNASAFCSGTDAAGLTGTVASARLSGSYTGITGTGTLTAGATGAGFTVALTTSTITGALPCSNLPALTGDVTTSSCAASLATSQSAAVTWAATQRFNPASNTNAINVNQCAETGSDATACVNISAVWNTSGAPSLIKGNVTNTASSASSYLIDVGTGGGSYVGKFQVDISGNVKTGVWQGTKVGVLYGGTNADLSATGGNHFVLYQNSVGGAVTVARPVCADLSDSGAFCSGTSAASLTGTLAAGQFPALTGDVTTSAGSLATTLATTQAAAHTWTVTQTHNPASNSRALYINQCANSGTDATACIELQSTFNTSGSPAALLVNVTNTSSGSGATLARFMVGGSTDVFKIYPNRAVVVGNTSAGSTVANILFSEYRNDVGSPQFMGNWPSSAFWGIGPNSASSDTTLRIGIGSTSVGGNTPTWGSDIGTLVVMPKIVAGATVGCTAAGSTALGLFMSSTSNLGVICGSGAPTVSAAQGTIYIRTDGSSTTTRLYVNTNGSTGWTSITTAT